MSIGGGSVSDMYNAEERGGAMALFVFGISLGLILGPAAAGCLTSLFNFRWTLWVMVILTGTILLLTLLLLRRTIIRLLRSAISVCAHMATGKVSLSAKMLSALFCSHLASYLCQSPSDLCSSSTWLSHCACLSKARLSNA